MEAIVVGDLHIDNRKYSIKNNETFDEIFRLFNQITDVVIERKPDFVIFLGDIFDSPENISTNVISIVSMLFKDLSSLTKVVIIAGNHDSVDDGYQSIDLTEGKNGYLRSSLVYPLGMNADIFVVDKPTTSEIEDNNGKKFCLSFVPYQCDIVSSLQYLSPNFSDGITNIMFGHFETRDLNYVKIQKDKALIERLPSAEELLTTYKQDLVFLGHVHDQSTITIKGKKLIYTGSARNINYNNKIAIKGIYSLHFDNLDVEMIANPNTAVYRVFNDAEELTKFVENTSPEELARTKVKFIYTDSKDTVKYHGLKRQLRRLEFEKSLYTEGDSAETTRKMLNFSDLKMENTLDRDSLFNFILDFKEIKDEAEREEYLKLIKSFEETDENSDEE